MDDAVMRVLVVLCLCAWLAGCSWQQAPWRDTRPVVSENFDRSERISRDLVGVLQQIDTLSPATTTLYTRPPLTRYAGILLGELQDAGYDIRIGAIDDRPHLDYTILPEPAIAGASRSTYTAYLSVGTVRLKRSYDIDGPQIRPVSSMFVSGTDATSLLVNDAVFDDGPDADRSPIVAQSEIRSATEPRRQTEQLTTKSSDDAVSMPSNARLAGSKNLYDLGESNYQSLFDGFSDVAREVLVFPNDSLVMPTGSKRQARALVSQASINTDVLSVVGCSHGKTALDNGNERLAKGRAFRVREELILAGFPAARIYHEGCWAPVHFDDVMPRRGVVLTLRRRTTPG